MTRSQPRLCTPGDRDALDLTKFRDEVDWVWPKVREHLTHCGVLIGPSGIEIRPTTRRPR